MKKAALLLAAIMILTLFAACTVTKTRSENTTTDEEPVASAGNESTDETVESTVSVPDGVKADIDYDAINPTEPIYALYECLWRTETVDGKYVEMHFGVVGDNYDQYLFYDCIDLKATEPEYARAGGAGLVTVEDDGTVSLDGDTEGDSWKSKYKFEIKDGVLYATNVSGQGLFGPVGEKKNAAVKLYRAFPEEASTLLTAYALTKCVDVDGGYKYCFWEIAAELASMHKGSMAVKNGKITCSEKELVSYSKALFGKSEVPEIPKGCKYAEKTSDGYALTYDKSVEEYCSFVEMDENGSVLITLYNMSKVMPFRWDATYRSDPDALYGAALTKVEYIKDENQGG